MRVRLELVALLSLVLAGCFEDPLLETVVVQMVPEDKAVVTVDVKFGTEGKGDLLVERMQQLNRDYMNAQDPWTRRFDRLGVVHEERTIYRDRAQDPKEDKYVGDLYVTHVRHVGVVPRGELAFLLGDSGVAVAALRSEGKGEILIVPGTGSLSTEAQRRVLDRHLGSWAASAVHYLAEARALYRYLETSPDRATACFASTFGDLVDDEVETANPLLDDEKEMVKRVKDAMSAMAEELTGMEELPYGLNELSYLVYDPLPAAVTICIPKEADRVEGFVPAGNLCYSIPRRGIIEAFDALDGRWLSPDPFVTWIRVHRSQGNEKLDLAGFAAKARSMRSLPDASSIIKALEAGMRHEPAYRLEWVEADAVDR